MKKRFIKFAIIFFAVFFVVSFSLAASAQTIRITPATQSVNQNNNFSLNLSIESVTNLFSVYFDLDYNSSLVSYSSITEGTFMSGCETSLLASESSPGKLIVGLTRLGTSCGGVNGSGQLMTINFRTLAQNGTNNFIFSNNELCILNGYACDYLTGTWIPASVSIAQAADTTPPGPPGGLSVN